jgi:hypothetical protein
MQAAQCALQAPCCKLLQDDLQPWVNMMTRGSCGASLRDPNQGSRALIR